MSVFETTSLTFGAAIAKQILNSWLGDNAAGLSGEPVDLLQGRAENTLAPREATRRIEKIGNQVAEMLRPVLRLSVCRKKFAMKLWRSAASFPALNDTSPRLHCKARIKFLISLKKSFNRGLSPASGKMLTA
jgi:hypothetical protein